MGGNLYGVTMVLYKHEGDESGDQFVMEYRDFAKKYLVIKDDGE
jgi:hypothetical protein